MINRCISANLPAPMNCERGSRATKRPDCAEHSLVTVLHGCLMGCCVDAYIIKTIPASDPEPVSAALLKSLYILAGVELIIGQGVRSKYIRPAFERLRTETDDAIHLAMKWLTSSAFGCDVMTVGLIHLLVGPIAKSALHIAGAWLYFSGRKSPIQIERRSPPS